MEARRGKMKVPCYDCEHYFMDTNYEQPNHFCTKGIIISKATFPCHRFQQRQASYFVYWSDK